MNDRELCKHIFDWANGTTDWADGTTDSCGNVYVKPSKYVEHTRVMSKQSGPVSIKRVDFNGPATIIFWDDQTKTVAKCDKEDTYDKAKGFLIAWGKKNAIKKEALIDAIDKWCPDAFTRPEPKKEQKKETKKTARESSDKITDKQFNDALSLIEDMLELGLLLRLLK